MHTRLAAIAWWRCAQAVSTLRHPENSHRQKGDSSPFVDCMSMTPEVHLAGYGVESAHFRTLAGSLPTAVSVVTTLDADGQPVGMTSGTVCSLSCEPPLLLVCMSNGSRTLRSVLDRGRFCVNVLDGGGQATSELFASAGDDKFDQIAWHVGPGGLPVLDRHVTAHALCEVFREVDGGDHRLVLGLITGGDRTETESPLVYFRRRYAAFPAQVHS